ncbi:MAG: DNA/RNA nuclease SfsA [Candidatus Lokiarchaeota archaeon]|nr:DNA/RNA nuclease SfsA [Candidatus Lokiarchaeota archaeon]
MILAKNIIPATFIKRPNRFLGYVELNGEEIPCFIPDPGRLKELLYKGKKVYLTSAKKEGRKTDFDLIAVEHDNLIVGIDSRVPNKHVLDLLHKNRLFKTKFDLRKSEFSYGNSRLDFYLKKGNEKYLLEVKGCNLVIEDIALFPDAPTIRGTRHVSELIEALKNNFISMIFFVIQRHDAIKFRPNEEMDPIFSKELKLAKEKGVIIKAMLNKIEIRENDLYINYLNEIDLDF